MKLSGTRGMVGGEILQPGLSACMKHRRSFSGHAHGMMPVEKSGWGLFSPFRNTGA